MKRLNEMTPLEILHAMIDESDELIADDTPVKAAWRALSEAQKKQAGEQLYAQHQANVDKWRDERGLLPVAW